jgi:cytochrome d ubiquinol oxidase subunit I
MELSPLLLSRIEFAFTLSFRIIFPAFTVGLAVWPCWLPSRARSILRQKITSALGAWE